MQKNKYKIAREVVEIYNNEYLQGDTMLHVHERLEEKAKKEDKNKNLKIDEDGRVIDFKKEDFNICESCGSKVKYQKVNFSKSFVVPLQKILNYVVDWKKNTGETKNIIEISKLNLTHTEYGNLNRIANFGLLYRETDENGNKIKHGTYGVPQKRIYDFLKGDWKVAKFYVVKSTTHERSLSSERVSILELKKCTSFVSDAKEYIKDILPGYVKYIDNKDILTKDNIEEEKEELFELEKRKRKLQAELPSQTIFADKEVKKLYIINGDGLKQFIGL